MLTTWLATLLISGLPEPYGELNLDQEQTRRTQAIVQRYERDRVRLTEKALVVKDSRKKEIAKNIDILEQRKDAEVQKLLTPGQRERLAQIRKLEKEGVPIGNGFFRSYRVTPHYPPLPNRFMSPTELWKEEILRRQRQDGFSFTVFNRSENHTLSTKFVVTLLDNKGKKLEQHEVAVSDLDAGAGEVVTISTELTFEKLDVRVVE